MTHYIIMSSSYSKGTRIALDFLILKDDDYDNLKDVVNKITRECGSDVSISTHFIQTDSKSWESVFKKDHFFKEVEVIDNIDDFINLIKKDRVLSGLDVAKYIICKVKCTHFKLEKLLYLCFAEYLCKYEKELFSDKIYAYKFGPIIKSVFDKYSNVKDNKKVQGDIDIDSTNLHLMPSKSRIIFTEDGFVKIQCIDKTLEKYGKYSALDLTKITNKPSTPWYKTCRENIENQIIDNKTIRKYHCNEELV